MASAGTRTGPFRAPTGTRDVVPPESGSWQEILELFAERCRLAGYGMVLTPLFEEAGVFARGVGTSTDIVRKEMYDFADKGGRQVALRPEATASVVRAFVENRPALLPWKVWYWGPMFRYERPQAGRYRQFFQLGTELIGTDDPEADVETVEVAWEFLGDAGVDDKALRLNSLGDAACRPRYREALDSFFGGVAGSLCEDHRTRYRENPMRVLDCKKPECVAATQEAPRQIDHLCDGCRDHFSRVVSGLAALGIPSNHDPRLVRGLDYYTRTTFEIAAGSLDVAQNAVGGGGRYDGLVEALAGPPTPAVGFSAGIERVLLARAAEERTPEAGGNEVPRTNPVAFVVDFAGEPAGRQGTLIARDLRSAGIATERDFGGRSPKAQFKSADRSGARFALVVGPEEAAADAVTVKHLREPERAQETVRRDLLVEWVRAQPGGTS